MTITVTDPLGNGVLHVLDASGGTPHRYTLEPGASLDGQPQAVVDAASAIWTPAILDAWANRDGPAEPPVPVSTPKPHLIGAELLTISNGEVSGFQNAIGFGFPVGVGDYFLYFTEDFGAARYSYAIFADNGFRAEMTERNGAYMRVQVKDASGTPVDPSELSIQLHRTS